VKPPNILDDAGGGRARRRRSSSSGKPADWTSVASHRSAPPCAK